LPFMASVETYGSNKYHQHHKRQLQKKTYSTPQWKLSLHLNQCFNRNWSLKSKWIACHL